MGSKMLIDAAHREETRVVVFRGNRIEEFDYESADRKQLKGNIYLAKVTRVEPSLQAAFVDYGGNRHGFLAFSEIHPDYYQIPIADREALLREEEEEAIAKEADEEAEVEAEEDVEDSDNVKTVSDDDEDSSDDGDEGETSEAAEANDESVNEDEEEAPKRRRKRQRRYRIQEVIKRRQVILVQVVKEERGNKGAALTTYLSLAGRYCVLMPNTARGGGISRKINDVKDRKRLKEVTQAMNVPDGAGLIVRTAGASRTKAEIKRDFDYLLRLWGNIRELTLESTAPSLVYEEGNLIKRSIRDLYTKDVDEVLVEGDQAYKEAKAFMKMLMPSHAKNVKHYDENRPLFSRFQAEKQLDGLYSPQVTLPSGGYLVMNQTEALVSIDINSGKATREHSIEKTALKTNIEASVEIARQLRLRDLAGLVVIDFIDMEERRNNRAVERKLKEALKTDRARIQVGRISHFGLLEMSRQRMRQSMLEGTTKPCSHCEGTGLIRSVSSCALSVLRAVEDHLINRKVENLNVHCQREIACFILNDKRDHLAQIEKAYNISIYIMPSDTISPSECEIQRGTDREVSPLNGSETAVKGEAGYKRDDDAPEEAEGDEQKQDGRNKRRRRRRGRRGRKLPSDENQNQETETSEQSAQTAPDETSSSEQPVETEKTSSEVSDDDKPKKRSRNRTRNRKPRSENFDTDSGEERKADNAEASVKEDSSTSQETSPEEVTDKPKKRARKKPARKKAEKADGGDETTSEVPQEQVDDKSKKTAAKKKTAKKAVKKAKPKAAKPRKKATSSQPEEGTTSQSSTDVGKSEPARTGWKAPAETAKDAGPARKGWWSK